MIVSVHKAFRRLRRLFSRSEWTARALGLPFETEPGAVGLVMIQIDGLSRTQVEDAIGSGRMPCLAQLIAREHYILHDLYSGLPSATAAFQGELFYGVKQAVPGFSFLDRERDHLVRMFEPDEVDRIERQLELASNGPLLAGGTALADNYTAAASSSHFCPTARGFDASLKNLNPFFIALLILMHGYTFVRIAALMFVELVLALTGLVRGFFDGEDLAEESKAIPSRVLVTILLRELVTIVAKVDIARGSPIVHMNFLGYDEQAHRRGPDSRFAHWSLKGIDDAIARVYRAAGRSIPRHYDVWIHSDHGQCRAQSYRSVHGCTLSSAVAAIFSDHTGKVVDYRDVGTFGEQTHGGPDFWSSLFDNKSVIQRLFRKAPLSHLTSLSIASLGPIAMVYWKPSVTFEEKTVLAEALVKETRVPLVLACDDAGIVHGWTADGKLSLPDDVLALLGEDHPHLAATMEDLITYCQSKNAGDFILSGWRYGQPAITFADENGSHGGMTPEETSAFVLLPSDITLKAAHGTSIRGLDLRHAALNYVTNRSSPKPPPRRTRNRTFRLVTYNVHGCVGVDGKLSPARIARVLARCKPDIVALQEVDVFRYRSGGVHQARAIADLLGMSYHFHPTIHVEEERYGDAILTHLPMRLVQRALLPGSKLGWYEPRGAIWAEVDIDGTWVQIINTHLGLTAGERIRQVERLMGPRWMNHPDCISPRILCGDFNSVPNSPVYKRVVNQLRDVQQYRLGFKPKGTFTSNLPAVRIDHVFVDEGLRVESSEVHASELARLASDHLPLVVELDLRTNPR